ncbi:MAG: hypothetical protein V1899_12410 [Planctomycetota bacterium]
MKSADSKNIAHLVKNETLVLSLMGTRGDEPAWNDRRSSAGHIGIPLASADFINKIPMMIRDDLSSLRRILFIATTFTRSLVSTELFFNEPVANASSDSQ